MSKMSNVVCYLSVYGFIKYLKARHETQEFGHSANSSLLRYIFFNLSTSTKIHCALYWKSKETFLMRLAGNSWNLVYDGTNADSTEASLIRFSLELALLFLFTWKKMLLQVGKQVQNWGSLWRHHFRWKLHRMCSVFTWEVQRNSVVWWRAMECSWDSNISPGLR